MWASPKQINYPTNLVYCVHDDMHFSLWSNSYKYLGAALNSFYSKLVCFKGGSGKMTLNMDTPPFIHGVLLFLGTTQYPPRNKVVTSYLTQIQPIEVWAVNYAWHNKIHNLTLSRPGLLFAPAARGAHCAPFWKPCSSCTNSPQLSFSESLSKTWSYDTLWFPWQLV